jgi:hypothetical protein
VGENRGARIVFDQIEQALDTPFLDSNGAEVFVQKVYVACPDNVSQATMRSIEGKLATRRGHVVFLGRDALLELFQHHWPSFLADEFQAVERYLRGLEDEPLNAPLVRLSTLYNLGEIDKQEAQIYVARSFRRSVPVYDVSQLLGTTPDELQLDREHNPASLEEALQSIQDLRAKIIHLQAWGLLDPEGSQEIARKFAEFYNELKAAWQRSAQAHLKRTQGSERKPVPKYVSVVPMDPGALLARASQLSEHLWAQLGLVRTLCSLTKRLSNLTPTAARLFASPLWERACYFDDCLRGAPLRFVERGPGTEVILSEDEIRATTYDLLIVGAAGFGKTSFCRRSSLLDARDFLSGKAQTCPVFVPLHTLASTKWSSFEEAFLRGLGRSALLDESAIGEARSLRLYLDGLDEVPSEEQQQDIIRLVQTGRPQGISVQAIITARDYVFAPWSRGFRRIRLGELTKQELEQLRAKWLGPTGPLVDQFEKQIPNFPVLEQVLRVPLLATLVLLIFRQTGTLPDSRVRLYTTFVDLLSGGWDLAKGVLRVSHFGLGIKVMILADLAAAAQRLGQRTFGGDLVARSVSRVISDATQATQNRVIQELLVDGIIAKSASQYFFSHQSFQEFLAARHMAGDPSAREAGGAIARFVGGDDWWREVLHFYIGLSASPESVTRWIVNRLTLWRAEKERGMLLLSFVKDLFPSFDLVACLRTIGKPIWIEAALAWFPEAVLEDPRAHRRR